MFIETLKAIDTDHLRLKNHEAADILHNVTRAYDGIFKKFTQSRAENKPLYVVMGEYHDRPAHNIAQTLLIRALNDLTTAPMVTALECPIDLKAADYPEFNDKQNNKDAICKTSAANIALLKEYITSEYAPFASQSFEASLCHQQDRLVTIFGDIARNEDHSLDLTTILGDNKADPSWGITSKSPNGVALRNIHMCDQLSAAVKKFKAQLAVQLCGQAHVNGSEYDSPKESISGLLREKKQNIFSIFWGAATAMPIHMSPSDFYIAENMPDRFIQYQIHSAKEDFSDKDLENYKLEKDYVLGVYHALGIKPPL